MSSGSPLPRSSSTSETAPYPTNLKIHNWSVKSAILAGPMLVLVGSSLVGVYCAFSIFVVSDSAWPFRTTIGLVSRA